MKKPLLFLLLSMVITPVSFAQQDRGAVAGASGYNSLGNLKTSLSQILGENRKLEIEYEDLNNRFLALQQVYKNHAAEIAELKQPRQLKRIPPPVAPDVEQTTNDEEAENLIAQSQIAYLQTQLLDADERLRLLRLRYSELQYAKRDFDITKKIADFSKKEEALNTQRNLDDLRREYENNLEQEKQLLQEVEEIKTNVEKFDTETKQYKQEMKDLQLQASQFQSRLDFKEQENEILRKKKLYETRLSENSIWQAEQKKIALQTKVNDLEAEFTDLNDKLNQSLAVQNEQRRLVDELMQADQVNQDLKNKINQLKTKTSTPQ